MKNVWCGVIVLTALILCVSLASCDLGHIEDTNGEEIALCSLTNEEIFSNTTSSTSVGSFRSQVNDSYRYRVSRLSGVSEFALFRMEQGAFRITSDTVVEQGNLRIVLLCDGAYVADIAIGKGESLEVTNPNGGKYEIRFAAESARFSFDCEIERVE